MIKQTIKKLRIVKNLMVQKIEYDKERGNKFIIRNSQLCYKST
ncbi:MAG: hypothetical protein ACOX09_04365 [Candidatus Kapaibacterium sp.]|jgi:hypothetical protein